MKYSYIIFGLVFLFSNCKKPHSDVNGPDNPNPLNFTPVPTSVPVNTSLTTYVIDNDQISNPLYVLSNNVQLNYNSNIYGFNLNNITLDKYSSTLKASSGLTANFQGFDTYKTFTTLGSLKNYANIKLLNPALAGSFLYDYGSKIAPLPGNGEITLPQYSFGHHDGSVYFGVAASYLSPSIEDYIVSLPCYPMYDDNQKRQYLKSYGIYFLVPSATDNSGYSINFDPAANVKMKLSIPANLLSNAPDSILTYKINSNNLWIKNKYAYKVGNNYEVVVDNKGFWNFAVPAEAVYVTVHIRTQSGEPMPNTRFKLKSGYDEIADERTNADGDALAFVPVNTNLTIEIRNDYGSSWTNSKSSIISDFGSFNSSTEKTINYPDNLYLFPITAKVFNCDGSPYTSGVAVLHNSPSGEPGGDDYFIPIANGKLKTSAWMPAIGYLQEDMDILDNSGKLLSTTKVILGNAGSQYVTENQNYNLNFYTCPDASQVYANYTIDTTKYEISGNAGASSPSLTATPTLPLGTKIEVQHANGGFGITMIYSGTGTVFFDWPMTVNGEDCLLDQSKGFNEAWITRDDAAKDGFVEGWFDINYTDPKGALHKIKGNFRVKKV